LHAVANACQKGLFVLRAAFWYHTTPLRSDQVPELSAKENWTAGFN
jgi:hypothetical protein